MNLGLSDQKREELQNALLDAFPSKASLEQMLAFELNKNLDEIATGTNLEEIVFNLIKIAYSENWIEDLIDAARNKNPENSKLKTIASATKLDSASVNSRNKPKDRSGQSNTKQVNRLVIKLDGIDIKKFLKDEDIQSDVSLLLKKASGDTSINIEKVEEDNIKITLSGTPEGLEKLAALIQSGELGELKKLEELGLSIEDANLIVEDAKEENESAEIKEISRFAQEILINRVSGRNLRGADLSNTNLCGAILSNAILSNAILSNANLCGADLSDAYLHGTYLRDADLRCADLRDTYLRGADLRGADLRGAKLSGAKLSGTIIDLETKLDNKWRLVWEIVNQGVEGQDLSGANLTATNLSGADLSGANLTAANLNGANLCSADLSGTNLTAANLTAAEFRLANLSNANLINTSVENARFGYNQGISEELKRDLIRRGAIFEDTPGDRDRVLVSR